MQRIKGSECVHCGCEDSELLTVGRFGDQTIETRQCNHCGGQFTASADEPEEAGADDRGCTWRLPRCPRCGSLDVPSQRCVDQGPPLVQRRKCRDCGHPFKSVGE